MASYDRLRPEIDLALDCRVQPVEIHIPPPPPPEVAPESSAEVTPPPEVPPEVAPENARLSPVCSGHATKVRPELCAPDATKVPPTCDQSATKLPADGWSARSAAEAVVVIERPHIQAYANLKRWIEQGTLVVGLPLPPERALAEKLKVDRGTVRRAVATLVAEGLVERRPGQRRPHVARRNPPAPSPPQTEVAWSTTALATFMRRVILVVVTTPPPDRIHRLLTQIHERGSIALVVNPQHLRPLTRLALLATPPHGMLVLTSSQNPAAPSDPFLDELQRLGVTRADIDITPDTNIGPGL